MLSSQMGQETQAVRRTRSNQTPRVAELIRKRTKETNDTIITQIVHFKHPSSHFTDFTSWFRFDLLTEFVSANSFLVQ